MVITFFGHSELTGDSGELRCKTLAAMRSLLEADPECTFYCGHKGQFDFLCEKCLDELKKSFKHLKKVYITPYFDVKWQKGELRRIAGQFDEIIFPPPCESCPPKYAWTRRNRWMVDEADIIISGVKYDWGGAAAALGYAASRGKKIEQL